MLNNCKLLIATKYKKERAITLLLQKKLKSFAKSVKLLLHSLAVKKVKKDVTEIAKGITDWDGLKTNFYPFVERYDKVFTKPNMKARYNSFIKEENIF